MLGEGKTEQSRNDRAKAARARREMFLEAMMDTPQGREWMWFLLTDCHMFQTSFSKSALEMAMLEGERNVGLKLTAQIVGIAPDNYVKMLRENGERNERSTRPEPDADTGAGAGLVTDHGYASGNPGAEFAGAEG